MAERKEFAGKLGRAHKAMTYQLPEMEQLRLLMFLTINKRDSGTI